jgi:hypothetical protein
MRVARSRDVKYTREPLILGAKVRGYPPYFSGVQK